MIARRLYFSQSQPDVEVQLHGHLRFHKTAEFEDILPRLTLEKEANRWKITKKWLSLRLFVAMVTVCNILILMKKKSQLYG